MFVNEGWTAHRLDLAPLLSDEAFSLLTLVYVHNKAVGEDLKEFLSSDAQMAKGIVSRYVHQVTFARQLLEKVEGSSRLVQLLALIRGRAPIDAEPYKGGSIDLDAMFERTLGRRSRSITGDTAQVAK